MIRDITIGQYYPADSRIHKLDPRVKIVCTLLYLISLFTFKSILGYVLATVFLFGCIKLAKVPFKFIVRGLKPIIILLLITVCFNLFLTPGGKTLVHVGFIKITEYGLSTAVYMAIRLIYLIMGSSLMTLTTTPNSLTDGLEKLLHPLNKLHVPVHEISMMMSIALRFIPILLEETDKIMKAQIARGADMESGNLIQKAKAMIPILVPLFVSAFRRANDLAMAMEARCYRGGNGRTKMKPLIYKSADHMAYLITILYVVIAFVVGRYVPFKLWIFLRSHKMRRIRLTVAYDGTNYCGWQIQPNGITIEEVLNKAICKLTGEEIQVIGASRTDSGVHARGNIAVFDTESRIPAERFLMP